MKAQSYGEFKIVGEKIGSGAFGEIYLALDKHNEKVAIKIEKSATKNPQLFYEAKMLQYLDLDGQANERGILKVNPRTFRSIIIFQKEKKM